jgi:predicted ATPase
MLVEARVSSMLRNLAIRNYKCLRDVQVELERFTVLVGPNASGKTSLLQATDWLCQAFRTDHPENLDPAITQSKSRGSKSPVEFIADVDAQSVRYIFSDLLQPVGLPVPGGVGWNGGGRATKRSAGDKWVQWNRGRSPLPQSVLLRLETSQLVNAAPYHQDPTNMAPSGAGLHSATANMALNDPDAWQELQSNLRKIISTIRRLRHTRSQNMHQPPSLLLDTIGADSLSADQVSEGTLLVLGLLAAIHSEGRPNLVLLDDLDRGLHPKAQRDLITLLRSLMEANPDLQIVATTHSPYMLDCMHSNEVRMTSLRDDGSTVCAPLSSHPKFPKWKDEMTPGEMWSLFGEKWLLEQESTA